MNRTQEKLLQAMVTAGLPEEQALVRVQGFSGLTSAPPMSMICPNCHGKMVNVLLIGKRRAKYCPNDRVVIPYPVCEEDLAVDSNAAYEQYIRSAVAPDGKETKSLFASTEKETENSDSARDICTPNIRY